MKRLWLAAALLAAAIAVCVLSACHLMRQTDALLVSLDALEARYTDGDMAQARRCADAFVREYDRRTKYLPCFLAHDELCDAEQSAHVLPALLAAESEEFPVELARCRTLLLHLRDLERPCLQNILQISSRHAPSACAPSAPRTSRR